MPVLGAGVIASCSTKLPPEDKFSISCLGETLVKLVASSATGEKKMEQVMSSQSVLGVGWKAVLWTA